MSISASASTVVSATPQEVLEFVLDLDRYRQADQKIRRVSNVTGPDAAGRGSVTMWGKLRWGPAAPDVQNFTLDRWSSLEFVGAPRKPARLVFDFVGTFDCVPAGSGTDVTHAYEFTFKGPFRLMERHLADWLQVEISDEIARIGQILGSPC